MKRELSQRATSKSKKNPFCLILTSSTSKDSRRSRVEESLKELHRAGPDMCDYRKKNYSFCQLSHRMQSYSPNENPKKQAPKHSNTPLPHFNPLLSRTNDICIIFHGSVSHSLLFSILWVGYLLVRIQHLKMERKNYHRKNGSTVMTARTKKTSLQGKSRDPAPSSRSKEKPVDRGLQNQIKKRMSFESPSRKEDPVSARGHYHNLSLLNYMLFKEKQRAQPTPQGPMAKDQFTVVEILGKGGFGKVYRVEQKRTRAVYAMKEMSKTVIITKKSIESVLNERELLAELKHPFIVNMVYAFQDRLNLYLVMDYMPGGDLRFQLGRCDRFPQNVVKFFVCSILLSLEYLHGNNIIHRDLKPQNLIFDGKGYLRLTDLGVARLYTPDNYKDTSGTPGYMAPEVINRENHSFGVDFFALGVIAYECMLGKRPYRGYNRQEIREQMLLYEAQVKPHQLPAGYHPDAINFINKLLKRKANERLGHNGIQEVLSHPWLKQIDWGKMLAKKYPSPFLPNFQSRNYDTVSESEYGHQTEQRMAENGLLLRKQEVQDLFKGYEYQEVRLT